MKSSYLPYFSIIPRYLGTRSPPTVSSKMVSVLGGLEKDRQMYYHIPFCNLVSFLFFSVATTIMFYFLSLFTFYTSFNLCDFATSVPALPWKNFVYFVWEMAPPLRHTPRDIGGIGAMLLLRLFSNGNGIDLCTYALFLNNVGPHWWKLAGTGMC